MWSNILHKGVQLKKNPRSLVELCGGDCGELILWYTIDIGVVTYNNDMENQLLLNMFMLYMESVLLYRVVSSGDVQVCVQMNVWFIFSCDKRCYQRILSCE